MRLLLSAIACSPKLGSEAHFGWNALIAAVALADDVHLLGHNYNRQELESSQQNEILPQNVHLQFAGRLHPRGRNRILARLNNWRGYSEWAHEILEVAHNLHRSRKFDLAQHVTVSTWRVASPLWKLPIPFIWGPIGGGEEFPTHFYRILAPSSRWYERLRRLQTNFALHEKSMRLCLRNSRIIIASNSQTARFLQTRCGVPIGKIRLLSAASFLPEQIARFEFPPVIRPPLENRSLRLFAGGDLEGRKGVALAIHALAKLRNLKPELQFQYTLAGGGAEIPYLQKLCQKLGLRDRIHFVPGFSGQEYVDTLQRSDIYLLPSLRDSAGLTLMEAMLAGCVPVVADCGGPGDIVTPECGIKVPVVTVEKMINDIAAALSLLSQNHNLRKKLSFAASERIRNHYSVSNYSEVTEGIWQEALSDR